MRLQRLHAVSEVSGSRGTNLHLAEIYGSASPASDMRRSDALFPCSAFFFLRVLAKTIEPLSQVSEHDEPWVHALLLLSEDSSVAVRGAVIKIGSRAKSSKAEFRQLCLQLETLGSLRCPAHRASWGQVSASPNPRMAVGRLTGLAALINTSFNSKGKPIVNRFFGLAEGGEGCTFSVNA